MGQGGGDRCSQVCTCMDNGSAKSKHAKFYRLENDTGIRDVQALKDNLRATWELTETPNGTGKARGSSMAQSNLGCSIQATISQQTFT